MGLNKLQYEAATTNTKRTLVLAGPGTGKTTTLVGRYVHLVRTCKVDPKSIFVATFTKKASLELRARIVKALPELRSVIKQLPIGTFHRMTRNLLRAHPRKDLGSAFMALHPVEIMDLVHAQMKSSGDMEDRDLLSCLYTRTGKPVTEIISGWKDRRLTIDDLDRRLLSFDEKAALRVWPRYEEILRTARRLDYSGLINRCADALHHEDDFRDVVHARFQHYLIDEYQDINEAQRHLISGLVHQDSSLWVVGDDDQSLYQFRGAAPKYIMQFCDEWPDAVRHYLSVNYRSARQILSAAQAVIESNEDRYRKPILAASSQEAKLTVGGFETDSEEAAWVAEQIEKLLGQGVASKEIVVLFRANALGAKLNVNLTMRNIKSSFVKEGCDWWSTPCVRHYIGLFLRSINKDTMIVDWDCHHYRSDERLRQSGEHYATVPWQKGRNGMADVVIQYGERLGMDAYDLQEWEDNVRMVEAMAMEHDNTDTFLAFLSKQRAAVSKNGDNVLLTTIHGAKGLEWDHVFLIGADDGQLPHRLSRKDSEKAEERRIMYVAMTRPRTDLSITYCRHSRRSGGPSPYLTDMMRGLAYHEIMFVNPATWNDLCDRVDNGLDMLEAFRDDGVRLRREAAARPYVVPFASANDVVVHTNDDGLFVAFELDSSIRADEPENVNDDGSAEAVDYENTFYFDGLDEPIKCNVTAGKRVGTCEIEHYGDLDLEYKEIEKLLNSGKKVLRSKMSNSEMRTFCVYEY